MKPGILVLAAALGGAGGCGGGCNVPPPPQSDICELAPGAPRPTVTTVEIGQTENGGFMPIAADSVVELVIGGQGSDMVVAALRVTGTGLGNCLAQVTRLERTNGELISSEEAGLVTSPDGAGAVVTGTILLPYYGAYGAQARIRASVAGTSDEVVFWAGDRGTIDAATDARTDARIDAGPVDGPPSDALTDAQPDA